MTLPWVPGLSPKLREVFEKSGCKAVFKSGANIRTILCSKNKMKQNSHPVVYKLNCSCKKANVGETGCKVSTRTQQHQQSVYDGNWEKSGVSEHTKTCHGIIDWSKAETLKVETITFERKIREAIDIQYYQTGARDGGVNQDGGYMTTSFWKPMLQYVKTKTLH